MCFHYIENNVQSVLSPDQEIKGPRHLFIGDFSLLLSKLDESMVSSTRRGDFWVVKYSRYAEWGDGVTHGDVGGLFDL